MDISDKLAKSRFRSKFRLNAKDVAYINAKGFGKIHSHACDFIKNRISPSEIPNNGKQTPYIYPRRRAMTV